LHLDVTIPANTTATVYVPAKDAASVREGDRPAGEAPGVRFVRSADGVAVYEIGSGTYAFSSHDSP
jgi:alpha-L-rhamnosidase